MNKNRVCAAIALLVFGAFGVASAIADEMTIAPALTISSPTSWRPWTGVHFGVNGGYGWVSSATAYNANDPAALAGTCGAGKGGGQCIPQVDYNTRGGFFGGQIGYNYQINSMWVTGVEADYQLAGLTGEGTSLFRLGYSSTTGVNTSVTVDQSVKSFGTVRLRMGAVPANPLFLYATGGLAFGQLSASFNMPSGGAGALPPNGGFSYRCGAAGTSCFSGSKSTTAVGWTLGAGGEYALSNNLTLKGEILYVDLGAYSATVTAANGNGSKPASFSGSLSPVGFIIGRGGLNLRF